MGKYALFVSVPYFGHVNPLLRQALELRRRGWRTAVATMEEVRGLVESTLSPAEFMSLGRMPQGDPSGRAKVMARTTKADGVLQQARLVLQALTDVWGPMYDGVMAATAAGRPDVIVVDLFSGAGTAAAEVAGIPCVVNNPTLLPLLPPSLLPGLAGMPGGLSAGRSPRDMGRLEAALQPLLGRFGAFWYDGMFGRQVNRERRLRGLPPVRSSTWPRHVEVLVDSAFGLEYGRPLPPWVHMVGPILDEEPPPLPRDMLAWIEAGPPVVFVNLGTVAWPEAGFLQRLAAGLAADTFRALWVLRPELQASVEPPRNVRMEAWAPSQIAVLAHPRVRAFVSHCGINSAHESLQFGTPIVGLPFLADQKGMAMRIRDAGVGLALDQRRFTPDELRSSIERVMDDPAFAGALPAVQASFRSAGGASAAADVIERTAQSRKA